jgi:hypothetical protein
VYLPDIKTQTTQEVIKQGSFRFWRGCSNFFFAEISLFQKKINDCFFIESVQEVNCFPGSLSFNVSCSIKEVLCLKPVSAKLYILVEKTVMYTSGLMSRLLTKQN